MFDLSGLTALVTGASRGIGAEAARVLDSRGARVILCARHADRLQEVSATLQHEPVLARADLGQPGGANQLLEGLGSLAGSIDILINNAGTHVAAPAALLTDADWDLVLRTNLQSSFQLARGLAPAMAERGWGKIVNVASILGIVADGDAAAYVASKAGLIGLTRALGQEWAASGITVNSLCPGWIETDLVRDLQLNTAFDRRVRRRTPAGRWGTVADLAGALVFLASRASDFMVGQTLVIDGGLTAGW
jgi:NAD(P)-dependent dehydrogenase (short-subunit alcohol dehydrogenase family)